MFAAAAGSASAADTPPSNTHFAVSSYRNASKLELTDSVLVQLEMSFARLALAVTKYASAAVAGRLIRHTVGHARQDA